MAPLTRRRKKALAEARPVIDPADRISKLPDEIQAHILSFLPAKSAVRTCVLARTWRDVWMSTKRLLIVVNSVKEESEFVDRLLRVRRNRLKVASLDACEIALYPYDGDSDYYRLDRADDSSINRWIHRVLECKIQIFRINIDVCGTLDGYLEMGNMPLLVSRHLTRLELHGIYFVCRCINLDGCPALEHLEINECQLSRVRKIMSLSLRRLVITGCDHYHGKRIQICVPRLVSLWLDNTDSSGGDGVGIPRLEGMPELVRAEVWIDTDLDKCDCDDPMACYHVTRDGDTSDTDSDSDDDEDGSGAYAGQNNKCVVLEGLAQATDLVLIANGPTFILRRDLRWCPTFSKLKTLVLSDDSLWQPADCSALACILEHAPLLEKLTIKACCLVKKYKLSSKFNVELEGHPVATAESTKMSKHLKMVQINCKDSDERILNVLGFLCSLNISFKITVTKKCR